MIISVVMSGTESNFSFSHKYGFKDTDSVMIKLNPESTVSMYAKMISGNEFKIVAASSLTDVKIKVEMRGY